MTTNLLSYAHGGSTTPMLYQTIGARFDEAATQWPDQEAIVVRDQGVRLTFRQLKNRVDPLAQSQALHDKRCNALGAVPTVFIAMLSHPDFAHFDVCHLRKGFIGGAPCPAEIMRRLIGDIGMRDMMIQELGTGHPAAA
jgi:acyl-CoA synthetase (AMP-forming)/AMP-acid ligase II